MAALDAYLAALPGMQAEQAILFAQVASLPYMKEADRRETIRAWLSETPIQPAPASLDSDNKVDKNLWAAQVNLLGIGVTFVTKPRRATTEDKN